MMSTSLVQKLVRCTSMVTSLATRLASDRLPRYVTKQFKIGYDFQMRYMSSDRRQY
jgi:hypothetical protein